MSLQVFLSFLVAASILIIIPGPTVLTIVSHGIHHGTRRSLQTIMGAALAHITFITLTAIGVNEIMMWSLHYFILFKWLGVAFLVGMGLLKIIAPSPKTNESRTKPKNHPPLLLQGYLVTAGNPKCILFYAAFFPTFLDPDISFLPQYMVLGSTFLGIFLLLSYMTSLFATRLTAVLARKNERLLERISGIVMVSAGGLLAMVKK